MILQNYNPKTFPQNRWWYRLYLVIVGALSFISALIGIGLIFVGWNMAGAIAVLCSFGFFVVMRALLLFVATGSWRGSQAEQPTGDKPGHNGGEIG